jgi:Cytochrome bd terminal oxidase subunit II
MEWYLPLIWAGVIGLAVAMYVILDGFDLGIGMLFPLAKSEVERDQMMHSIAPFWDGNETWLVLGGTGLLVAFPLAYGIIMPAFYVPVIIMLLALVFRGIAFEFRGLAGKKAGWNAAFVGGSTLATLCQGVILGGLVQGIKVDNAAFAGGTFEWATPFAVVCAFGVAAGYALLGATWLVMKTEGEVARRARAQAKGLLVTVLAFLACQHLDAAAGPAYFRALVLNAEHSVSVASSARNRCRRPHRLALAGGRRRARSVYGCNRSFPARLSRPGDLVLPLSRAANTDHLADCRRAHEPSFHAYGHAGPAANGSRLHRLQLLAVSRKSARRWGIPLMDHSRRMTHDRARND